MQSTTEWLKQPEIARQTAKALGISVRDFLKGLEDEETQNRQIAVTNAIRMRPVYRRMIEAGIDIRYLVEDDPLLLQTYLSELTKWNSCNSHKESPFQKQYPSIQASI